MTALLKLASLIDALSERVGRGLSWVILAAVLISAGNAIVRKAFNYSSNAFLEIQWYLFSAVFLVGAGYTLLRQEHVRIDVILSRFSRRKQVIVEAVCTVLFLFPFCAVVIDLVWPLVMQAYRSGEMSGNAGGLIRWPVYALVPLGFGLLWLQGISELIKRLAFLAGVAPDPGKKDNAKSDEEALAEFLRVQAEQKAAAAKAEAAR